MSRINPPAPPADPAKSPLFEHPLRYNRVLIPVGEDGSPDPVSFVYHLPGNYSVPGPNGRKPRARVPVQALLKRRSLWSRLVDR